MRRLRNVNSRYFYSVGRIGNEATFDDRRAWGFGKCLRCQTAWCFVHGHDTKYRDGSACFPLCEECWSELTPVERLPFYRVMWERWRMGDVLTGRDTTDVDAKWSLIEAAVLVEEPPQ